MVPLTKPLSEDNTDCHWVPYPRRYQWFHIFSPGPEGLGDSTWSLQNLLPLVLHGPDYVRGRLGVHKFPLVPLIPRGSTVSPRHPKTPVLVNGATTETIPVVPHVLTWTRRSGRFFMVPPEPVTVGPSWARLRPRTSWGSQIPAGDTGTFKFISVRPSPKKQLDTSGLSSTWRRRWGL
jgi:hypothetical protein